VRAALWFVATLIVSAGGAAAQPPPQRDRPPDAPGTGIIRGRVFDAGTGQPMRQVRVRTAGPGIPGGRTALTDVQGRYELTRLPPFHYTISAAKPLYVNAIYGQARIGVPGPGLQVDVGDGQVVDHVDIRMSRGGVISGRITDEAGEPMNDVQVAVVRMQAVNGLRRPTVVASRVTNDIGEFRLFGVQPGQYYVSAIVAGSVDVENLPAYASTFYPGTTDVAQAQSIAIEPGAVLSGLNMTLLPARAVGISGVVFDAAQRPVAGGSVFMNSPVSSFMGAIKPDGSFSIRNVTPGQYVLRASVPGAPAGESAMLPLSVGDVDIEDIRLAPVKPTIVKGRLVVDLGATAQPAFDAFRVTPSPADLSFGTAAPGAPVQVKPDGTFELRLQPRRVLISGTGAGGWHVKAVRANGDDITDTGIDISGESMSGLELIVTNVTGSLSGRVVDAAGRPASDASIVIFTQDRSRWHAPIRFAVSTRPRPTGEYTIGVTHAGPVYVVALENIGQDEWLDPVFLERVVDRAVKIDLVDGQKQTLDLTVASER